MTPTATSTAHQLNSTATTYQTGPTPKPVKKDLDMAAFLNILTTEMANQNPLEPLKDSEYFGQIAQMGTVQGIDAMKTSQQNVQATGLIGKNVTATRETSGTADNSATPVSGPVQYVVNKSGTPYLGVKESNGGIAEVPVTNVTEITN